MGFFSRFYIRDDVFHRAYEALILLALATSVLHIRTVPILSDPNNPEMFIFCLGVFLSYVLLVSRYVEVFVCQRCGTKGLFPEAAGISVILGMICYMVPTVCYGIATAYAGAQFFGSPYEVNYDDAKRMLAGEESKGQLELDDVAAWICVGGGMFTTLGLMLMVGYLLSSLDNPRE